MPRKLLLATSVVLLLSFGAVASAAPIKVSTNNEFSPYFKVSSTGLVTA
ncbi:hypothetical protein ACE3MS_25985 [Paenibacillus dendritiformis]